MEKVVSILLMVVAVFTLTACNSSKLDKTGEEFKKAIIAENSDLDNKDYKESDFSFLIYKDKDTNRYLAEAWIPYEGKSNDIEEKYLYNENKKIESEPFGGDSFDYVKSQGNYEVVYKSGKFK